MCRLRLQINIWYWTSSVDVSFACWYPRQGTSAKTRGQTAVKEAAGSGTRVLKVGMNRRCVVDGRSKYCDKM